MKPTEEQINKRLTEYQLGNREGFFFGADRQEACYANKYFYWEEEGELYKNPIPDYCSEDSPRSLLSGLIEQLSDRKRNAVYHKVFDLMYENRGIRPVFVISATAKQLATAIYGVLDDE
jgi:hypothetical protein